MRINSSAPPLRASRPLGDAHGNCILGWVPPRKGCGLGGTWEGRLQWTGPLAEIRRMSRSNGKARAPPCRPEHRCLCCPLGTDVPDSSVTHLVCITSGGTKGGHSSPI